MLSVRRHLTTLLVCCACRWAGAHNPDGQIHVATLSDPYLILIRDPAVLRELRATETQRRALSALADELDGPLWTLRNQSAEKTTPVFRELIAKAEATTGKVLSAAQLKRLEQYRVAVHGLKALVRDDVAAKLKLTDEQRSKLRKILDDSEKPASDESKGPSKPRPGSDNPAQQVAALLSREQLARARDILGPSFDIGKLGFVKFKAPELLGPDGWLNSPPLSLAQLKGQVIALHFWTYG